MPKPTLLVCQSCHSAEDRPDDQLADGDRLYQQLNTLAAEQLADLEIQAVGCLWTCDQPCAVAYTAADKPTYLFTTIPADETAIALLQFGDRYSKSKTGNVPWKQFPEELRSAKIARIPVPGQAEEMEEEEIED
jgi:predicted metal-binding protein